MSTAPATTSAQTATKKSRKSSSWANLRGLVPYLGRYKGAITVGMAAVLIMVLVGSIVPLATGIVTDTLAGSQRPFERSMHGSTDVAPLNWLSNLVPYYEPHSRRTLAIYCLVLVACIALKGIMSFISRWVLIGVSRDIEFDIRSGLLDRLLVMEPEFYVRNRTGELMSRATNDLNSVRMVLGPGIMYSANTIGTMVISISVMVILSKPLTLWVLLPVPIVAVAVWYFGELAN